MTPDVTVRFATRDDATGLQRLAALDAGVVPTGPALVAFVGDELAAALPLGGGEPIADPFRPTDAVVRLLRLREAQLRGRRRGRRRPLYGSPQVQAAGRAGSNFPNRR